MVPAEIPAEIEAACLDYALARAPRRSAAAASAAPTSAGTRRAGSAGSILLEINTQPGMTPTSLAPEQAAHRGISFGALVRWMVEDASCSR